METDYMATGRTISASFLTEKDKKIIELCSKIAETIKAEIPNSEDKKKFNNDFGKTSLSRD
jgi:hypothetical protein